ncbi:MAG: hypothetical protein OXN89_03975 [Bryobacterales bacterium]|nr:hypothetical protein [Bryobacterales bacterium]
MTKNGKPTFRIGTWNTEWVKPDAPKGNIISYQLAATDCDILCVTEGYAGILPDGGHVIDAGEDWGCPIKKGRRKVLLWSKRPWTPHSHALGSEESQRGRFVAGTTEAAGVCLTVIGVCIPWKDSKVQYCTENEKLKPWEDHKRWLHAFEKLNTQFPKSRTVVLGDFNQRKPNQKIPKGNFVPAVVHNALLTAFTGFKFATEGELPGCLRAIDHIAHTVDLTLIGNSIKVWPKFADLSSLKLKLSDHFGVRGDFRVS